jgi:hypothetical protein
MCPGFFLPRFQEGTLPMRIGHEEKFSASTRVAGTESSQCRLANATMANRTQEVKKREKKKETSKTGIHA